MAMSGFDVFRLTVIGLSVAVLILGAVLLGLIYSGRTAWLEDLFGPGELAEIEFATLERQSPSNSYLACPEGLCTASQVDQTVPVYPLSVDALQQRLIDWVDGKPDVTLRRLEPETRQYHFVARTPRMRFPDLVTIQLLERGADRSTLAIYSRSVYGKSDLGKNEARVKTWLAVLAPETA
ncbi:DUF1499 domain-containing protein [Rhodothalassium salexigens]|uniref:DUF1499 domain-containing protein n=1 Tax=Rhodothalassium salexigens TaxID=1086 RepID=UPI0019131FF8|nr:DUF1499 domain-containing protein [Rhodothalassium salexigens]